MEVYLLRMMAISTILYAAYFFFFSKEKMLVFSRVYLLVGIAVSFVIPLITITVAATDIRQTTQVSQFQGVSGLLYVAESSPTWVQFMDTIVLVSALLITVCLIIRFGMNFIKIKLKEKRGDSFYVGKYKVVLLEQNVTPHSFLNTIFLSKLEYTTGKIEAEVFEHELAHVRQQHSLDIIFIELVMAVVWFNPIVYLFRRSIKINHELLADAAVVKQHDDVRSYQQILLQRAMRKGSSELASSFNFYTTKKRFIMLQKTYQKRRVLILGTTTLPLFLGLTLAFCNRVDQSKPTDGTRLVSEKNTYDRSTATNNTPSKTPLGISGIEMEEFKSIVGKTTVLKFGERTFLHKDSNATKRALMLYSQMTDVQKELVKELNFYHVQPPLPPVTVKRFSPPKIVYEFPEGNGASIEEIEAYEAIIKEAKVGENGYREIEGKTERLYPIYKKMTFDQRSRASQLAPPPPPPKVVVKQFTPPKIVRDEPGPGTTEAELLEYETIINEIKAGRESYKSIEDKTEKLYSLFQKMTWEQRDKASELPPPHK